MNKEKLLKYMKDIIKWTKKINYTNSDFDKNILNLCWVILVSASK
ncbi:hypothetical protein [Spiroplasma endosymbiont of Lasioglossum villosulum]